MKHAYSEWQMHIQEFANRQLAHAKQEGEKYSSVSADCRSGSSGGEVDWWLVRCHLVETVRWFGEVFLVKPT